jgi:hypothetical protein
LQRSDDPHQELHDTPSIRSMAGNVTHSRMRERER